MGTGLGDASPARSLNPDTLFAFAKVTYDGSGVPSNVQGKGFDATPVDDGTGLFSIVTQFPWRAFLGGGFLALSAAAGGMNAEIVSATASTRTLQVRLTNAAGAAADPGNADGVFLMLAFQVGGSMPA